MTQTERIDALERDMRDPQAERIDALERAMQDRKRKERELGRKMQNLHSWLAAKGLLDDDGSDLTEQVRKTLEEG